MSRNKQSFEPQCHPCDIHAPGTSGQRGPGPPEEERGHLPWMWLLGWRLRGGQGHGAAGGPAGGAPGAGRPGGTWREERGDAPPRNTHTHTDRSVSILTHINTNSHIRETNTHTHTQQQGQEEFCTMEEAAASPAHGRRSASEWKPQYIHAFMSFT